MKNKKIRKIVISLLLGLLLVIGINTTYTLLTAKTDSAKNTFAGSEINIAVKVNESLQEDYSSKEGIFKKISTINSPVDMKVSIKNLADDCYVRVRIIPIVKDSQGQRILIKPNISYAFNTASAWKVDGETYYYSKELIKEQETDTLLKSVTLMDELPVGCTLEIQVLADAIATRPASTLQSAWGITNFNKMMILK